MVEDMNKTLIFGLMFTLIFLYGCVTQTEFEREVEKIGEIDKKYGASLKSPPETTDKIDELIAQLIGFSAVGELPESVESLIDFKLKFLEAEKLHAEGWQWGRASTTEFGFGCKKGYARITESARLRNASAQKGFEAVDTLQFFVESYPQETKSINLTQIDVLILKATYFQIQEKALRDGRIVKNGCKDEAAAALKNGA